MTRVGWIPACAGMTGDVRMAVENLVDYQLWQFPDFDQSDTDLSLESSDEASSDSDLSALYEEDVTAPVLEEENCVESDQIVDTLVDEKLQFIDELSKKMQETYQALDAALLHSMSSIIKKSIEKILYQKLSLDPALVQHMIEQVISEMNLKNTACEVRVSSRDYAYLSSQELMHVHFKEDAQLKEGDFVIVTAVQQIQALVSERIDMLMDSL